MQIAWQRRIERARELARQSPVAPDLLEFYQQIAAFQAKVAEGVILANLDLLLSLARRPAADPMHAFFARVVSQAKAAGIPCRPCAGLPLAVVLRPGTVAVRRLLLCGLCFAERESAHNGCLSCGNTALPALHTHEEFPHIRVEACQSCRAYLKAIDVTRDGTAVPEVDELASVVLDLWAAGNGYTKLQPNLFGM